MGILAIIMLVVNLAMEVSIPSREEKQMIFLVTLQRTYASHPGRSSNIPSHLAMDLSIPSREE